MWDTQNDTIIYASRRGFDPALRLEGEEKSKIILKKKKNYKRKAEAGSGCRIGSLVSRIVHEAGDHQLLICNRRLEFLVIDFSVPIDVDLPKAFFHLAPRRPTTTISPWVKAGTKISNLKTGTISLISFALTASPLEANDALKMLYTSSGVSVPDPSVS